MVFKRVYADNAATTAMSDIAFQTMLPYFKESFGNPSATYSFGIEAKNAIEEARRTIAKAIGARVNEITFTSGGTESDNWALHGAAELRRKKGKHIITTEIEHSAVYKTAKKMEQDGYEVTFLPVNRYGQVSPSQLEEVIREDTILVSIMLANNEIGTILPIKELCNVARKRKVLFHTDAVQVVGHIPVNVQELGVDLLSISAHKFRGPKGIGVLYVNLKTVVPPMIIGGGQEKGRRSGTSNVPGIVGMAAAIGDAAVHMEEHVAYITSLRDRLIDGVLKLPGAELTGDPVNRLPGMASFIFKGFTGEPLVPLLNEVGICASSGSACSAGSGEPSRILQAAGYSKEDALSPLRFSLNEDNTVEDVDYILSNLPGVLQKAATEKPLGQYISLDDY
jgi:cysteine desulfurase